jgi:hypothetical protein
MKRVPDQVRYPLVRSDHDHDVAKSVSRGTSCASVLTQGLTRRCPPKGGDLELRTAIGHVRDGVRAYGVGATFHDLACRAVNHVTFFQILRAMAVRITDVHDQHLFDTTGFDARFVAEDELHTLAGAAENHISPEFLRRAAGRGDRCYALFDRGALATYGWYADLPTPFDDHFTVFFDRSWTYMYKGFTLPKYRGRRLHAKAKCKVLRALTQEGRPGIISCVSSNNFSSLRSAARMGYRKFGDVYLLRTAGRSFAYASSGCLAYGLRVEPDSAAAASGFGSH